MNAPNNVPFPAWAAELGWTGISSYLLLSFLLRLVATLQVLAEPLDPAAFLLQFCLPLPPLGLQLIDPLLLSIQLLTRPGKERKNGKKKSINTKRLNKTPNSTGLMLLGVGIVGRRHPPRTY